MYQLLKVRNLYNVYIKNTDILSSKNKLSSTMKIQKYSNLRHELIQDITDVSLYTNKPAGLLMGAVIVQINRRTLRSDKVKCFSAGFHLHSVRNNPSKCKWQLAFFLALLFDKLSTCFSSFSTDI